MTLTFTGGAPAGVASTEFRCDGTGWQTGTSYRMEAPADHANDGEHVIDYRSTDTNGTVETSHTCKVRIDTRPPTTSAPRSATVRRYGYVSLRYRVNDAAPCAGTATVTIRIKTLNDVTKHILRLGVRQANTTLSKRFRCSLSRGRYRFYVYAVDAAGNRQSTSGRNTLTVR